MINFALFKFIFAVYITLAALGILFPADGIVERNAYLLVTSMTTATLALLPTSTPPPHASIHTEMHKSYLIFRLEKGCKEECLEKIVTTLTHHYRCSDVTIMKALHYISSRCDGYPNVMPHNVGVVASTHLEGIRDFFENKELGSISVSVATDSLTKRTDDMPSGMKTWTSRFVQLIRGELPWGLDRIDQTDNVLDGMLNLTCFPRLGSSSKMFILDSGCRATHEDFRDRIATVAVGRYSTAEDAHGHGTHIAGIAAGTSHGVCKKCRIICVKTLDENNSGTELDVVSSIEYVMEERIKDTISPFSVVLALGGATADTLIDDAVSELIHAGVFVATASGNNYDNSCKYTPGRVTGVVNAAATTKDDRMRSSSNGGECVSIMAPGEVIRSASHLDDELYISFSGSSMAAPHVAGVAALLATEMSGLGTEEIKKLITRGAKKVYDRWSKASQPLLRLPTDCSFYSQQAQKLSPTSGVSALPSPMQMTPGGTSTWESVLPTPRGTPTPPVSSNAASAVSTTTPTPVSSRTATGSATITPSAVLFGSPSPSPHTTSTSSGIASPVASSTVAPSGSATGKSSSAPVVTVTPFTTHSAAPTPLPPAISSSDMSPGVSKKPSQNAAPQTHSASSTTKQPSPSTLATPRQPQPSISPGATVVAQTDSPAPSRTPTPASKPGSSSGSSSRQPSPQPTAASPTGVSSPRSSMSMSASVDASESPSPLRFLATDAEK